MAVQQFLMMGRAASGRQIITGEFWVWGRNTTGNAGTGNTTAVSVPVQLGTLTNFQNTLSPGSYEYSRVIVKSDGTLWSWGQGNEGVLGHGNTTSLSSPVQVGTDTDWLEGQNIGGQSGAVKTDGTLWMWGSNNWGQLGVGNTTDYSSPVQAGTDTDWAHLLAGAGSHHTVAFKTDGTIYYSGYGDDVGATRVSSMTQLGTESFADGVQMFKSSVFWKEA